MVLESVYTEVGLDFIFGSCYESYLLPRHLSNFTNDRHCRGCAVDVVNIKLAIFVLCQVVLTVPFKTLPPLRCASGCPDLQGIPDGNPLEYGFSEGKNLFSDCDPYQAFRLVGVGEQGKHSPKPACSKLAGAYPVS